MTSFSHLVNNIFSVCCWRTQQNIWLTRGVWCSARLRNRTHCHWSWSGHSTLTALLIWHSSTHWFNTMDNIWTWSTTPDLDRSSASACVSTDAWFAFVTNKSDKGLSILCNFDWYLFNSRLRWTNEPFHFAFVQGASHTSQISHWNKLILEFNIFFLLFTLFNLFLCWDSWTFKTQLTSWQ